MIKISKAKHLQKDRSETIVCKHGIQKERGIGLCQKMKIKEVSIFIL